MKKVFVLSLLAFAALVACQKNSAPVEENGVPMSISISWNDVTKTYQKTTGKQIDSFWDGKESVSIISLGEKQEVLAIDNFVSEDVSGAETAVFTGKFTGGKPYAIKVMYPALKNLKVPETPEYDGTEGTQPLLALNGDNTFTRNITPLVQYKDFDFTHFTNYCLAVGDADFKAADSGVLVMKNPLQNVSSVLKFELKLPEKTWGLPMDEIKLWCEDAKGFPRSIFACGKEDQDVATVLNGNFKGDDSYGTATGKWIMRTKFEVPKGGLVTLFMPVYFLDNVAYAGEVWNFEATVNSTVYNLGKKAFKEDTKLARGYMYRISIDASAEGIPAPGWEDGDEVPLS